MSDRPIPKLTGITALLQRTAIPPNLSNLTDFAAIASYYARFTADTIGLFPQTYETILAHPRIDDQVTAFAAAFETSYFPMSAHVADNSYFSDESLLIGLYDTFPFEIMGISLEELHEIWQPSLFGIAAMLLLIDIDDIFVLDHYTSINNSIRISWLEDAADYLGQDTLDLIPTNGIPQRIIAEALEHSQFKPVADVATWAYALTDNPFLYYSRDDDLQSEPDFFDYEVVKNLTAQWYEATSTMQGIENMAAWIEADPATNFTSILNHILQSPAYMELQATT